MGKVNPEIIKTLKLFKSRTSRKYNVEKMILFGSQADGTARADSDIDLIVVTRRKSKNLVAKLIDEWHVKQRIEYPVDFINYTKADFERESKRITLAKVALQEGIEIV